MDREKIIAAIRKAKKGIGQYTEIMNSFRSTDVSIDREFQRKFNFFYRVRQRTENWYKTYYSFMQQQKGNAPSFSTVLRHLYSELDRYEPSFSSKFVATHDPELPIWDAFVLKNTGIKAPYYSDPNKLSKAEEKYKKIQNWYKQFLVSDFGNLIIEIFNENVPEQSVISDLKKIGFVLWQTRA